ncbi:HlyD family efflux transporter periplasmic adaptor subunit [Flavobacteriaceae bacterium S356]|uniref:HlyD family efflux transporter periplasmic adaptor subunit n=1 Tax=Asprobacillus argus TaxID=3076534 RepID=A0ABU3LDU0_9FLAO|nr:HlyD family efflux transporter periplasmic adaptor subunit [Flavobacteriaceae bacterium S356]
MLNISHNKLNTKVDISGFKSGKKVFFKRNYVYFNRFLVVFALIIFIVLFLPWTQNVTSTGNVTTLKPSQRPQTIQSPIPGKIEKWFVNEGDFVKKGDTILFISEVKNDYFDPKLRERTQQQIDAKSRSVRSYEGKVQSLENQINALKKERVLKMEQSRNKLAQSKLKVVSDSIDFEAAKINFNIATKQYDRTVSLEKEGLKAVRDVENKKLKLQETAVKKVSAENKLLASKNEVLNARIELNRVNVSYNEKISKVESNKFTAQSGQFDTEAQVTKLENSYSNYTMRSDLYYIRAPQSGYINKALRAGIGETFKEGERLVGIMPANYEVAVETFIMPIDLPLIHVGEKVQIQFDGWPAIVFSGWPNASYGTFTGVIVAVENFISDNGKYRVLIAPDKQSTAWPEAVRVGSGARTMALLKDVPIWFELWRKLNGFPPNYYESKKTAKNDTKK